MGRQGPKKEHLSISLFPSVRMNSSTPRGADPSIESEEKQNCPGEAAAARGSFLKGVTREQASRMGWKKMDGR